LKKIPLPLTKSGHLAFKIVIKKGKILKLNLKRQSIDITHSLQCALKFLAGGKWGHAPRGAGLGGALTHFIQTSKKCVFQQQKFGTKYALKCVFF